jgi:excisionase family DNA binding protein
MRKKPAPEPEGALYVRLPAAAVEKLDRASSELGVSKKDLIAGMLARYDVKDHAPTLGTYSFEAYDPPEVLNAKQAGDLLQVDHRVVLELAEAGKLPGRKLGPEWRFSRAALIAWLSVGEEKRR